MDPTQRRSLSTPSVLLSAAVGAALFTAGIGTAAADSSEPPLTIGAGIQTSAYNCWNKCVYSPTTVPAGDSSASGITLNDLRLYVNGSVTDTIKFTFNTDYNSGTNSVIVMDAIARFEFSPEFNIWAGRFLEPADRSNLYGAFYANDWTPYADGVADYYPFIEIGRDNGIAYWGDFGPAKVQVGIFDGESLGGDAAGDKSRLLTAARLMWDFWDKEKGYYLNGTYYGDKDILAVGISGQNQNGKNAFTADGLMEKNLHDIGVVGIEAEYQEDKGLVANGFNNAASHGWYVLADYLFPQVIGWGKFQLLDKYSHKSYDATALTAGADIETNEVNFNYIIKEFGARVGVYYVTQTGDTGTPVSPKELGLKLQLQL